MIHMNSMNKIPGKKNYRDDQLERTRRVQKVGGSSLSVTLPKNWIEEINLRPGDILTFKEMSGGRLELAKETQGELAPEVQKTVHIEMDLDEPNILTRLIVGSYIAGHDNVIIRSKGPFSGSQKDEADAAAKRMLGLSLVEHTANSMEFQNFIDPIKYRLDHIMSRVMGVLSAEIEACRKGIVDSDKKALESVFVWEDEVDSFYLLMIRQLLLSSENYRLAKGIGIEDHRFQMGYRLVIKDLEMVGDLVYKISKEIWSLVETNAQLPETVRDAISGLLDNLKQFVSRSYDAFRESSLQEINAVINDITGWLDDISERAPGLTTGLETPVAITVQRIVSHCTEAVRLLIVMDEVAFNRSMERDKSRDDGTHINVSHRSK